MTGFDREAPPADRGLLTDDVNPATSIRVGFTLVVGVTVSVVRGCQYVRG